MKKLLLSLLLSSAAVAYAQDAVFLNNQQFLVHQNPSFAGSNGGFRFQSIYKNQPAKNFGYVATYNSADLYLKKIKAGMAVTHTLQDWDQGTVKHSTIAYSYAQHLSVADNKLKIIPSLQIEVIKRQFDPSKLSITDYRSFIASQSSNEPATGIQQKYNYSFSSGLLFNYNKFYFGVSIFHINQPNIGLMGDTKLPSRLSLYGSANLTICKWMRTNISAGYEQINHTKWAYINTNTLIGKHFLFNLGLNTRILAHAGLGYRGDFFTISFGYGASMDIINPEVSDVFEAHLSINIRDKEHRRALTNFEAQ